MARPPSAKRALPPPGIGPVPGTGRGSRSWFLTILFRSTHTISPLAAGHRSATAKDDHYTGKQNQAKTDQSPSGEGGAIRRRLACAIRCTHRASRALIYIRITGSLRPRRVALFAKLRLHYAVAAERWSIILRFRALWLS